MEMLADQFGGYIVKTVEKLWWQLLGVKERCSGFERGRDAVLIDAHHD